MSSFQVLNISETTLFDSALFASAIKRIVVLYKLFSTFGISETEYICWGDLFIPVQAYIRDVYWKISIDKGGL